MLIQILRNLPFTNTDVTRSFYTLDNNIFINNFLSQRSFNRDDNHDHKDDQNDDSDDKDDHYGQYAHDGKDDHDDDRHEKGCLPRGSIGDQR